MGCVFPNKNVLKPFNGTSTNEEHLNNFVPLTKENRVSTTRKKNLNKKNDDKKILNTLLNMHAIVVKHYVSHFKLYF
jgi:hypothetical protein